MESWNAHVNNSRFQTLVDLVGYVFVHSWYYNEIRLENSRTRTRTDIKFQRPNHGVGKI